MNVWKVILVTLVIFSTGMVTGGLLVHRAQSLPPRDSQHQSVTNRLSQGFKPERALRMDFIMRVKEELGLTQEQLAQIEAIVQESQIRTREIWERCSPPIHAEFKATKEKINAVLTESQREEFEQLMRQHRPPRKEDREHNEGGPPPEPGPGGSR